MNSPDFDHAVEVENVNLLHRYKLFLNISNLFHLIEFLIAVALILRSSSRIISVLKSSGDNLLTFSSILLNHRFVFLVGNVIIIVCYVRSRYTDDGNRSEKSDEKYSSSRRKIIDGYSIRESVTPPPEENLVTEETSAVEDDSIGVSVTPSPEETTSETATEDISNENAAVKMASENAIEVAIKQAVRQIERFRRTQSEKLKREMLVKPHRDLQRSATVGRGSLCVHSDDERSSETVEKMSNEEFQVAVESFIWKQQSFLKQEGMAENGTEL